MENPPSWLDRLAMLAKYRKFLMRWFLLWILIGVIIAFAWPPRYRAESSFLPPTEDNGGFMAAFGPQLKMGNVSDIEGAGFMSILHSKRLKDSLDSKFDFRKRYGEDKLEKAYELFDMRLEVRTLSEEAIGFSKIHTFFVYVSDKKPEDAAAMTNAVVYYADRITSELTTKRQRYTREFLEGRVQATKESLLVAEDSLRLFSQRTGIVAPEAQVEATIKALAAIEEQIAAADVAIHVKMTTLGSSHPRVKEDQARKLELEKQRDELSGKIEKTITSNLIALKQSPELTLEYTRRYREMRLQETLLSFLQQQLEQARIGESRTAPVLRILDQATAPESRRWPIRSLVVLLVMAFGFFCAMIWISWKEWRLAMAGTEFDNRLSQLLQLFTPKTLLRVLLGKE